MLCFLCAILSPLDSGDTALIALAACAKLTLVAAEEEVGETTDILLARLAEGEPTGCCIRIYSRIDTQTAAVVDIKIRAPLALKGNRAAVSFIITEIPSVDKFRYK
jgi:hypothetical protein